jgi:Fic/DOC family
MIYTDSTFAIEQEAPTEDKARTFMRLLRQAHERRDLTEDYLVALQNATIANAFDQASQFRVEQNWLKGPGRGALSVTYVPPPPELAAELMAELMVMGNTLPKQIDPVLVGAIMSFGFVFIHPFMDGNGRLSRFLFHHALCRSGQLADGLLLPISVAMKRSEDEYLSSLQTFSRAARELWNVRWIDEGQYDFTFNGAAAAYRFWDATPCVEFGFKMAEQALEHDLRHETEFLADYDTVTRKIDAAFDVRGSDLSTLVVTCFDNGGVVSKHRRKQFANTVPEAVFEAIQTEVSAALAARHRGDARSSAVVDRPTAAAT